MKELLQKIIAEKKSTNSLVPPASISAASTSEMPSNQLMPSVGQPVTAVQVPAMPSSSGVGLATAVKPAAIAGSKVTVGAIIPNSTPVSQVHLPQTFSQAALDSLSGQLPKQLREKIVKLPKEQQRFVYMHHLRQLQQLKEQQHKQQQQQAGSATASPKVILEKQRQLVQEQQVPLVVGVAKSGAPMRNVSATVSVGSSTADARGKANFATMRILPGSATSSGTTSGSKRKGKGKDSGLDIE